jgi:hypothetical protein
MVIVLCSVLFVCPRRDAARVVRACACVCVFVHGLQSAQAVRARVFSCVRARACMFVHACMCVLVRVHACV